MCRAHLRVLPPWAAPEAQRGNAANQGCTERQEIQLSSGHLTAGTAEFHRGPWRVGRGGGNEGPARTHWEFREDAWNRLGGWGRLTAGKQYSQGMVAGHLGKTHAWGIRHGESHNRLPHRAIGSWHCAFQHHPNCNKSGAAITIFTRATLLRTFLSACVT